MMAAPSMAEVLAKHEARWTTYGYERPYQRMHCASADCNWSLRQKVSMSDDECYAIHRAHVAQALAAAGFGHVASVERERDLAIRTANASADFRVATAEAQVAAAKAEALEEAADAWTEWEVYEDADGARSIRRHDVPLPSWLRARAARLRAALDGEATP